MNHFLIFLKHIWKDIRAAVLVIFILTILLAGVILLATTMSGDTSKTGLIAKHISFWVFIPITSGLLCYGCFRLGLKLYHYFKKTWAETGSPASSRKIKSDINSSPIAVPCQIVGNHVFVDLMPNPAWPGPGTISDTPALIRRSVETDVETRAVMSDRYFGAENANTCPGCGLGNWEPKCPRCNYSRHGGPEAAALDEPFPPESNEPKKLTRYTILKNDLCNNL